MVNEAQLRKYGPHYDKKKLDGLTKSMKRKLGNDMASVIAIEELSELIQATSKWLRFDQNPSGNDFYKNDKMNLCEEIADATIALHILKQVAGISGAEINRMIAYKVDHKQDILNRGRMVKK